MTELGLKLVRVFVALLLGVIMSVTEPAEAVDSSFPIRAAFYYPWFPETEKWRTQYSPTLGNYDSSNRTVLASHVAMAKYGGMDAFIASWWGVGSKTDGRLSLLLDAASAQDFKITPYYEQPYPGASDEQLIKDFTRLASLSSDPAWLRVGGKPVLFVYNSGGSQGSCEAAKRYVEASAGHFYLSLKVFGGYRTCPVQPDAWHQYAPARHIDVQKNDQASSVNVAPGFWKFNEDSPRLVRDIYTFIEDLTAMKNSGYPWQLITSFNEWGEGTSVEPSFTWSSPSGYGSYLDMMRFVFGD